MAFTVRCFAYREMTQLMHKDRQFTGDTVFTDTEPYEWRAAVASNGLTPVGTVSQTTAGGVVRYLRVEVPDGQAIRYEINPPGRGAVPDANSPVLSGLNRFEFYDGWTFNFIDQASAP